MIFSSTYLLRICWVLDKSLGPLMSWQLWHLQNRNVVINAKTLVNGGCHIRKHPLSWSFFLWFSLYFLCCVVFTHVTVVRLFLSFFFFAMVLSVNLRLMNLNMLNIDLLGNLRIALIAKSLLSFKLVVILLRHHRYFVHSKIIKEIMQLETDSQQLPMMAYLHKKHTLKNT